MQCGGEETLAIFLAAVEKVLLLEIFSNEWELHCKVVKVILLHFLSYSFYAEKIAVRLFCVK